MPYFDLEIVGQKFIQWETPTGTIMRTFPKFTKPKYRLHQSDEETDKNTIYEFSLQKSTTKPTYQLSILPCLSIKYVKALQEGKTLLIDEDIIRMRKND